MNIIEVPREAFDRAGVRPVCGFDFMYNPNDAQYGVCVRTDGTLPQIAHVIEAGRVGSELQRVLFNGQSPTSPARLYL